MNIQDAIKSMKPFKRKESTRYMCVSSPLQHFRYIHDDNTVNDVATLFAFDVIAEDWETRDFTHTGNT
jgi:hypothetical protein